jgi:dihydroflavonol-4-reductase
LSEAGAKVVAGDVLDAATLNAAFSGCEAVFHLAAAYRVGLRPAEGARMVQDNIIGTRNVFERAVAAGATRIVYTSSCTVYVNTAGAVVDEDWRFNGKTFPNAYVESKHRAHREVFEPMCAKGAPIIALLPGAVLGPDDPSIFAEPLRWLAAGKPIPIGQSRWAMVGVDDCAHAHLLALERGRVGECYNIVAENLGLSEAVARAGAATGLKPRIIKLPDWFIAAALPLTRLLERFVRFPPALSSESLNGQWSTFSQTLSGDKARRELGFEPASLDAVLREVVTAELDAKRSRQPKH